MVARTMSKDSPPMVSRAVNRCQAAEHMCRTSFVSKRNAMQTRVPSRGMVCCDRERDSCMHPSFDCVSEALDMQNMLSVDVDDGGDCLVQPSLQ